MPKAGPIRQSKLLQTTQQRKTNMPEKMKKTKEDIKVRDLSTRKDPKGGPRQTNTSSKVSDLKPWKDAKGGNGSGRGGSANPLNGQGRGG
jgi:hypothetical protein